MARTFPLAIALVALAAAALAPAAGAMDLERLIAPTDVCADQADPQAPVDAQEQAMRCMTNFARERMGMGALGDASELDRSAGEKSADILRCDSFSHEACGREFTFWMQHVGYTSGRCWRAGENIAWGSGELGSVRSVFRTWIRSPEHRANILGSFGQIGVGLDLGTLQARANVHVWTQHFGSHCGQSAPSAPRRLARLAAAHRAH